MTRSSSSSGGEWILLGVLLVGGYLLYKSLANLLSTTITPLSNGYDAITGSVATLGAELGGYGTYLTSTPGAALGTLGTITNPISGVVNAAGSAGYSLGQKVAGALGFSSSDTNSATYDAANDELDLQNWLAQPSVAPTSGYGSIGDNTPISLQTGSGPTIRIGDLGSLNSGSNSGYQLPNIDTPGATAAANSSYSGYYGEQ
jgi:hypothetical protein